MGCKYWKRDSVLGEYHCTAPAEESEQELEALEQRIDELLSTNGSLQFKNDQLSAKYQRLDVAEKWQERRVKEWLPPSNAQSRRKCR